jgi:hypothetical protein
MTHQSFDWMRADSQRSGAVTRQLSFTSHVERSASGLMISMDAPVPFAVGYHDEE